MILTAFVKASSANFSSQNLPNFRYHEPHIKMKTTWPPWIFRKSPWETTKFLNCPKTRMFRKDKQFLLHMWHPSCYSIKSFDHRKDRNQDQWNVHILMAYKVVIRPYKYRRDTFCLNGSSTAFIDVYKKITQIKIKIFSC